MTPPSDYVCLVSNFREALSILENLRASSVPGRGMRHLRRRPVVESLRASEVEMVTGGLAGEFPVLCRVERSIQPVADAFQSGCVPLSRIVAFVFGSEAKREIFTGKLLENASTEGLRTEVAPHLFGAAGPPRFQAARPERPESPEPGWARADALAGAAGAVLALCRHRPATAPAARAFLLGEPGLPISPRALSAALDAPEGPWEEPCTAASAVAFALRSTRGQDPLEALEMFVDALGRAGYPGDRLAKFRQYVTDIVMDRRPRRPQELADAGDILLRALLVFLQRERLDEILDDSADGVPPGHLVHLVATALGGLREGLARMPSAMKSAFAGALGEFAGAIEDDPAGSSLMWAERLVAVLPPEAPPERPPAPPEAPPGPQAPPTVTDLVKLLEGAASDLGLVDAASDHGVIGTCPSTRLVARIAPLTVGAAQPTRPVLLVSVGGMEDSVLLREALKGAVRARPGSFLCLREGEDHIELAFPIDLAATGQLADALAGNVDVVRQWRSASERTAGGQGEKPSKGRRKATRGTTKTGGRTSASGADPTAESAGENAGPVPPGEAEAVTARPGGPTVDPSAAPYGKRSPTKRSGRRKTAQGPVPPDHLATASEAATAATEPSGSAVGAQAPDAPGKPHGADELKTDGAGE